MPKYPCNPPHTLNVPLTLCPSPHSSLTIAVIIAQASVVFYVVYFPSSAVSGPQYSTSTKVLVSFLAPSAFALGAGVIAQYEAALVC